MIEFRSILIAAACALIPLVVVLFYMKWNF